jgi:hypothetical protein
MEKAVILRGFLFAAAEVLAVVLFLLSWGRLLPMAVWVAVLLGLFVADDWSEWRVRR